LLLNLPERISSPNPADLGPDRGVFASNPGRCRPAVLPDRAGKRGDDSQLLV
jgi:hypothetical protein